MMDLKSETNKRPKPAIHFEWREKFNSQLILSELASARSVANGRSSFNGGAYAFWLPVIKSAIKANSRVGNLGGRCIEVALSDAQLTLNSPTAFLERCDRAYEHLSALPKTKFVVYSTLTYTGPKPVNWLKTEDVRIQWQPSDKGSFVRAASKARDSMSSLLKSRKVPNENGGLTTVTAHVSALNPHDAQEKATDALDVLRGLLNLLVNSSRSINPFADLTAPHAVNKFRRGAFQTVHLPDGSLASEMFWYEPRWQHDHQSVKFKDPDDYRKSILKWWGKIQENPLRDHICAGLLRYCRALDHHESDTALLEMWGALEFLTGTQNERYDITIDRIERLFRDRDHARLIASHIRHRRNQSVHAARSLESGESDAVLIHAEMLVSRILFFCIKDGANFVDKSELFEFLSLSYDEENWKRRDKLSKLFFQYQKR
ncbi:hypothetical protein ACVWZZ_002923 [Bradyrhizobium sp. LM6.10]